MATKKSPAKKPTTASVKKARSAKAAPRPAVASARSAKSAPGKAAKPVTVTVRSASSAPAQTATKPARATIPAERKAQMIAEAAYFIAEQRGFAPGDTLNDWLVAESRINATFRG